MRHTLLGSTAERMVSKTTRPMLVVQAPLALQDGAGAGGLSAHSLRSIHRRRWRPGASLGCLRAYDVPYEE